MLWTFFSLVLFSPYGVRGTLTPSGTVAVDCGGQQTFTCNVTGITTNSLAVWFTMGLVNITATGLNGVITANRNPRISTSTGAIVPISTITIADFTMSDNGGTVQCINTEDGSEQGTATISVEPLPPPSNATATTVGHDCTVITLQWDKPDTPSDITSTVSCTSSTTACGACTSSPCDITGLELNTDYNFTVTLNSGMCGVSMATTTARTLDVPSQLMNVDAQLIEDTSVNITWDQPSNYPPLTSVTVTCIPSSPSLICGTCPPSGPCTISGLDSNTTYIFTVTPNNNCGPGSASYANATTNSTASRPPTTPTPGLPIVVIVVPIVAAIILVVLVVIIVIVVVIWCMKKKHGVKACPCIKNGEGDVIYEDPEKNNDNIKMQSSPAYQTVSSVCGTKDDCYYPGLTDDVKMEPSPAYQTVS